MADSGVILATSASLIVSSRSHGRPRMTASASRSRSLNVRSVDRTGLLSSHTSLVALLIIRRTARDLNGAIGLPSRAPAGRDFDDADRGLFAALTVTRVIVSPSKVADEFTTSMVACAHSSE